jgi:hypothetical protein
VPFIYFRVFYNVVKLAGFGGIHLLIGWTFGGIFYLLYGVAIDLFYYMKILCDYKEDDDKKIRIE